MEENREIEIDLRKIFSMLKKKAAFIVIFAILGATIAGCFTNFFIEPKYTATVKLHAYSSSDNRIGANSTITSSEFDASQKLVNTYLVVIQSNTFNEKVSDALDGKVSAGQIKSMMSCSQIDETLAFRVNVKSTDKKLAKEVANAIAQTCPEEIVRILKVGGVEVIDYATEPQTPSSPNIKKNMLVGFAVGFAISFLYYLIRELFDTKVHDRADLEKEFDIPIIGMIPTLIPIDEKAIAENGSPDADGSAVNVLEPPAGKITSGKESK